MKTPNCEPAIVKKKSDSMSKNGVGKYLPCVWCGKKGYTDQREEVKDGHICVRCARPDIDWKRFGEKK
jgi:uncharacterized membrane protein